MMHDGGCRVFAWPCRRCRPLCWDLSAVRTDAEALAMRPQSKRILRAANHVAQGKAVRMRSSLGRSHTRI